MAKVCRGYNDWPGYVTVSARFTRDGRLIWLDRDHKLGAEFLANQKLGAPLSEFQVGANKSKIKEIKLKTDLRGDSKPQLNWSRFRVIYE